MQVIDHLSNSSWKQDRSATIWSWHHMATLSVVVASWRWTVGMRINFGRLLPTQAADGPPPIQPIVQTPAGSQDTMTTASALRAQADRAPSGSQRGWESRRVSFEPMYSRHSASLCRDPSMTKSTKMGSRSLYRTTRLCTGFARQRGRVGDSSFSRTLAYNVRLRRGMVANCVRFLMMSPG